MSGLFVVITLTDDNENVGEVFEPQQLKPMIKAPINKCLSFTWTNDMFKVSFLWRVF